MAIALLNYADDEGYFAADSRLVRAELCPFTDDYGIITGRLQELSEIGYITIRDHAHIGPIGHITNFSKHQVINKPKVSTLKAGYECESEAESAQAQAQVKATVSVRDDSGMDTAQERKGREGKGPSIEATSVASARNAGKQLFEPLEVDENKESPTQRILFDYDTLQLQGITEDDLAGWRLAYPAVELTGEIERAKQWLIANPVKRKKNICRFLTNWLSKTQEKGGSIASASGTPGRLSNNTYQRGTKC